MKAFPLLAGLLLAAAVASPVSAQSSKDVAKPAQADPKSADKTATVNGKVIPRSRVEFLAKMQSEQGKQDNEQLRKAILDQLVAWELVVQEADRKGVSKDPEVLAQLDVLRQQIIFQAYVQDHLKTHPITEAALHAEYDKAKAQRGAKEYKARHILVEKEADAKNIIAQLRKGGKFEELAKQSKDIGSREKGGELDWQPATTYVKPFGDALMKLQKGKTTESPVRSQFGFHVIRLDDVREAKFPAFDTVRSQITNMLQRQEVQQLVNNLRAKARIE